nr:hypothetical protein BaRGS_023855 [Batillaria attramentaria]
MTSSCTFSYQEDGLHADCSRLQLTSLPSTWPDDVVWLDMSHNKVSVLTHLSHPNLAHLRHLDLSHNQLPHTLANHTFSLLGQLTWLSLRGNRLHGLQADALKELGKLTFLDLSMNQLQDSLPNKIFSSLQQLQWLSLQDNHLKSLEVNAMTGLGQLTFLDISSNQLRLNYDTYPPGVFHPLTSLQELKLHGNDDRWEGEYPEDIFKPLSDLRTLNHCTALLHLGMSNLHISPEFFRTRAWRLFRNLELLQTLDLSLNILVHIDPHMLRAQRRLKELNLAGNRLQSLSVDLEPHKHLELLDMSHNMLPTLLPAERQALDSLAATHNFSLRLRGNPLLCACSNLDFVRWLWGTAVRLDGDGSGASNYTCVTETGEVSDTHSVMAHFDTHWRRCVGQTMLGVASAAFLLQLLVLVIVYVVSRSWTHLRYVWKVMKRLQLPLREHFLWDAYAGYADADLEFACLTLPACLEERHSVRLLLRDREELPGSIRAESIVEHIDNSWKVLLFVTRAFAMDDWACGFTVQQAQRSITDTMPDRVIVIFMEDPARLPPMASLERLLRMVPESNVLHVKKETPPGHPVWDRVAEHILGKMQR